MNGEQKSLRIGNIGYEIMRSKFKIGGMNEELNEKQIRRMSEQE